MASDPSKALAIAQSAGRLAETGVAASRERALAIATSQRLEGEAELRLNNPALAKPLLAQAFATVNQQANGSVLQANILVSRARLESATDQMQGALADYLSAFEIYKNAQEKREQAVTLQDIGLLYHDAGDYDRALSYYTQSKATYSSEPVLDLSVYNNRADALGELHRYREARADYLAALGIAEKLNSPSLEAQILSNLAVAEISDGNYGAAKSATERGLRLARSSAAGAVLPTLLSTSAQLAMKEGRLGDAKLAVAAISQLPDAGGASERDEWVHRTKYEVYKAEGDDRGALKELEAYQKIQAGHRMLMASANTALMAARFDFDNQNRRIADLKTGELRRDVALAKLRVRQGRILIWGILIIVTAIAVFLTIYLRTLRNNHRQTRKTNLELSHTNSKLENALQAKTQFLATTSHEIRTPLNGVLGMTEVLLAGRDLSSWARQRVALIHSAGEAMRVLVDDLLDMSKMDASQIVLEREMIDLPTLLWEIHRFWLSHAESAGLTLALDIGDAPVMILEDGRRLRQILSNLLSNAVKFTPAGSITLSARAEGGTDSERLIITVSDTGIGIVEDAREMIFEKFNQLDASITRKYGGTGLGLSIALSLARSMDGNITVNTSPSGGSEFVVNLPLRRLVVEETSRGSSRDLPKSSTDLDVTVVEANPITQGGLRSLLGPRVGTLAFCSTIGEAVETLGHEATDVVIASLPKGGYPDPSGNDMVDLARTCQKENIHLVVISDPCEAGVVSSFRSLGASLLERPVSAGRLAEHLENLNDLYSSPAAMRV